MSDTINGLFDIKLLDMNENVIMERNNFPVPVPLTMVNLVRSLKCEDFKHPRTLAIDCFAGSVAALIINELITEHDRIKIEHGCEADTTLEKYLDVALDLGEIEDLEYDAFLCDFRGIPLFEFLAENTLEKHLWSVDLVKL